MAIRPTSELVTDRTSQDVQLKRTKGNLNVEDLNRIGEWQTYIRDLLNEYGYYVNISPKTDFVKSDLTNMTTKINKIKNDLQSLKDAYYVLSTTPDVPSTERLAINYVELNNIEKVLNDIEFIVESMMSNYIYCGVARCGQNRVWQQRFIRKRTWDAVPFSTFSKVLDALMIKNITTQSDEIEDTYSKYGSTYGNILFYNQKLNELDEIVGGNE